MEVDSSCGDWLEGSGLEIREDCNDRTTEMGMYYIFWVKKIIDQYFPGECQIFFQYIKILIFSRHWIESQVWTLYGADPIDDTRYYHSRFYHPYLPGRHHDNVVQVTINLRTSKSFQINPFHTDVTNQVGEYNHQEGTWKKLCSWNQPQFRQDTSKYSQWRSGGQPKTSSENDNLANPRWNECYRNQNESSNLTNIYSY